MPGENEFDMSAAVSEIGGGLGFEGDSGEVAAPAADNVSLEVAAPAGEGETLVTGEVPVEPAAPADTPATPSATAPRTWRAEAAAEFDKLPPVVQAEILKREEDIFKGIEGYKEAAAFGNSLKQVLDPYLPTLQQYGIQPAAQVADMMQAHYTLAFGSPEQKAALFQQVAKDYGVDLSMLSMPEYVDPQVSALQNELKSLKSQMSQAQNSQAEAKKAEITKHVQAFAADPKNVYFEELANDIAHLLRTGAESTVEAAYEKAVWMNPAVRAKELSRQQTEKAEAERKATEEKAAAARKATAANVRTRARTGSAAAPVGSMDDTLNETLAGIRGRS